MKAKVIIILLLALFFGCKTTKQTTSVKSEVSEQVQNDLVKTTDSSSVSKATASVDQNTIINDSTVIEETIVELSEPDSAGSQHPQKITTRKTTAGKQTKQQTTAATAADSNNTVRENTSDNSKKQTEASVQEKTTEKHRTNIGLAISLIVGLAAGLLIIAYVERKQLKTWLGGVITLIRKFISI